MYTHVHTHDHTCANLQHVRLPSPSSCSRGRWGGCPLLAGCPRLCGAGCRGVGTAGRLPARSPALRHLASCQRRPPGTRHRAAFVPPAGHARLCAHTCVCVRVCVCEHTCPCVRSAGSIDTNPPNLLSWHWAPPKATAGSPAPAAGHGCARPFRGTRGARGGRVVINLICTCKSSSA